MAAIVAAVDARLDELLAAEQKRWLDVDDELGGPIDEIHRMVHRGGKRLRPAFCRWGFVGAGGDPSDQRAIDAGAAIDLYLRRMARAGWRPDRIKIQVMLEPHRGSKVLQIVEDVLEVGRGTQKP